MQTTTPLRGAFTESNRLSIASATAARSLISPSATRPEARGTLAQLFTRSRLAVSSLRLLALILRVTVMA
jgi:hypothetical protein